LINSLFSGIMVPDEGSSSVTSSPMQCIPFISLFPSLGSPYTWLRELKSEEKGLCLIHLLLACSKHVATGGFENANIALEYITSLLHLVGTQCSTLLHTFLEHLLFVCSEVGPFAQCFKLHQDTPYSKEFLVQKLFSELCPFLKLTYLITNHAIEEAMEVVKWFISLTSIHLNQLNGLIFSRH
ncbi:hypothetical protein Ancab_034709, partial [Ancistrocladus abbreviatus]